MILDVCGALATILIPAPVPPDPDPITRVALDIEPMTWNVEHLYVYPTRVIESGFETGASRRQDFDLLAVYVTDNEGEEAHMERSTVLGTRLDDIRGAMLAAVRGNQATALWSYISALTDSTSPRTLDKRSASVRITGWRIVGGG